MKYRLHERLKAEDSRLRGVQSVQGIVTIHLMSSLVVSARLPVQSGRPQGISLLFVDHGDIFTAHSGLRGCTIQGARR
jgi:hypothetical protein